MIIVGVTVIALGTKASADDNQPRPNFVVILCDDLGYGDLSCYGHPHIETPHLDKLAASGVRLTSGYSAAPVCSPSRVGLLTGRSPNRAGVYDWIPPAGGKRPDARDQVHMRRKETTIAHLLKSSGYATCLSGKWHCNSRFNSPEQPQPGDAGFDHWFATQNNAAPSHENPVNFVRNGKRVGKLKGYSCQLVVDEAINWLDELDKQSPNQPFFLLATFHEPHEPVASPPQLVAKYRTVARNENEAQYFANVENVDQATGRLLATLDRLGKSKDTLVIFTSDNGPETLRRYRGAGRSYGTPGPLRGMKLWTTEAGSRVASIMSWPARIKPAGISDEPVSSLDFLPTFCELSHTKRPDGLKLDGTSFLPLLEGKPILRDVPLFWCYFNSLNEHRVAMRDGPWKLLAKLNDGRFPKLKNVNDRNVESVRSAKLTHFELYRVRDDIGESKNVIAEYPKQAALLKQRLVTAYRDLADNSHHWTVSAR
jgi:arylsulfatase A